MTAESQTTVTPPPDAFGFEGLTRCLTTTPVGDAPPATIADALLAVASSGFAIANALNSLARSGAMTDLDQPPVKRWPTLEQPAARPD